MPIEKSRHIDFMKQIQEAKGAIDFVLIGDSITDGWPGKAKDTYAEFLPWKPLNLGVSGEQTEQVLWRLLHGELEGYRAKAIMILIGTNNLGHFGDEKPDWTAAGVKKIVETVEEKQPQAKILLLGIFPRSAKANDSMRMRVIETNKLLAALKFGPQVTYLDISDKFLDAAGDISPEIMPDFLHPNAAGYKVWLDAVKPTLELMMK